MINPFISNNDKHSLLRKNYQIITKPKFNSPTNPTIAHHSATKLQLLQHRNPFQRDNLLPPTYKNHTLSQSRSLSASQIHNTILPYRSKLGKSRYIDQVEGWKQDLQKQERNRLKMYGIQGLRYHSYTSFSANQNNIQNQYYASELNNIELERRQTGHFQQSQPTPKTKVYQHNRKISFQSNNSKRDYGQYLQDEIIEDGFNRDANRPGAQHKPRYGGVANTEESMRQSKMADMFGSDYFDGLKRQMKHNSNSSYGSAEDDLIESKRQPLKHSKSKFTKQLQYQPAIFQSSVLQLKTFVPSTIAVGGQIYFRIQL